MADENTMIEEWKCTVWTYLPRGGYSEVVTKTGATRQEAWDAAHQDLAYPVKRYEVFVRTVSPFVKKETVEID